MGREAGADQRERLGAAVVHRQMPVRALEREELRRRVVRALAAELRILGRPDTRGEPDAALLVHHRIVDRGLAVPDRLLAPVGRRRHRKLFRRRRLRIAHRHPELRRRVGDGIEHRQKIGAFLRRAVDRPVGVDARVAPVGRDLVVEVILRAGPIPHADDDVALLALRSGRLRLGQLARGDAVRPVGVERQRPLGVEPADIGGHLRHRLAGLDAPLPRLDRGGEGAELLRDRAGGPVAERVTAVAAVGLHDIEPLCLRLQVGRHAALRSSLRELARRRDLQHRVPVDRREILRRRGLVRRDHGIRD